MEKNISLLLEKARMIREEAEKIVLASRVFESWESVGGEVRPVGSFAMGLLMKHRDLDFHIYTSELQCADGLAALERMARGGGGIVLKGMEFQDLSRTEECCLEWHVRVCAEKEKSAAAGERESGKKTAALPSGLSALPDEPAQRNPMTEEWQIDMIQILRGSRYDGYFERVAERIRAVLTPETRLAILSLKDRAPAEARVPGIAFYRAVIGDGVRTWPEFEHWLRQHPLSGILEWMP